MLLPQDMGPKYSFLKIGDGIDLMKKFADEFEYGNGNSEWHIFERMHTSIRITGPRSKDDQAFVWPAIEIGSAEYVDLVCVVPKWHLRSITNEDQTSWQHSVGPHGTWTVKYIKQWIQEKFIPKVCNYYATGNKSYRIDKDAIVDLSRNDYVAFDKITEPKHLLMYLYDISEWASGPNEKIATKLLQPYYKAFLDLVRQVDPSTVDIRYCAGKLVFTDKYFPNVPINHPLDDIFFTRWTYRDILDRLERLATRIQQIDIEDSRVVDNISRVFLAVVREGHIHFTQAQLNLAKQALLPLWEHCRFEIRHVHPNTSRLFNRSRR